MVASIDAAGVFERATGGEGFEPTRPGVRDTMAARSEVRRLELPPRRLPLFSPAASMDATHVSDDGFDPLRLLRPFSPV
jgi:hypothetical protein